MENLTGGCIQAALVNKNAGASKSLRAGFETVLRMGVQCLDAPPLPLSHPAMIHRDAVLALCLSPSELYGNRCTTLRACLTSDISSPKIVIRCVVGVNAAQKRKWAADLAGALLPMVIEILQNQR